MTYQPPAAPPKSVRELESIVAGYAKENGFAPGRVRRWISFTILSGVLERGTAYDGSPLFWIKGGVAIERRLGSNTRSTKDFDTIFRDDQARLIDAVDQAFHEPYQGWALRRDGDPEQLPKALRINVKLEYQGRAWGTVPLEVSAPEGTAIPHESVGAMDLAEFGLSGPHQLPCLPLRRQLAQKIHAMTERPETEGKENHRFKDLYDLWRLAGTISVDHELRAECKQIFRLRDKHSWPPTLVVYASWPAALAKMAADEGVDCPAIDVVTADVERLIAQIDALSQRVFAEEFGDIQRILTLNTDLKDEVYALVQSAHVHAKVLEGSNRLDRFRGIMERLVAEEIDLAEAVRRTERYLSPRDSPYSRNAKVFPSGWAIKLVRTELSRFYNQAVAEQLLREGATRCFVAHSSAERSESKCSQFLAGKDHDLRELYAKLTKNFGNGDWDTELRIPNHPYCTHVIAPVPAPTAAVTE